MAKWIYEKWQPAWPEATGNMGTITDSNQGFPLNFDGTEGAKVLVRSLSDGQVYRIEISSSYHAKLNSTTRRMYPDGKPTAIKGTRLPDVTLEEGTVPDDGVHSDQFWYVKVKKAFPTMRILRDGQWAEVETGYVLKDGVWKPIEEIYKLQDGQWVQA